MPPRSGTGLPHRGRADPLPHDHQDPARVARTARRGRRAARDLRAQRARARRRADLLQRARDRALPAGLRHVPLRRRAGRRAHAAPLRLGTAPDRRRAARLGIRLVSHPDQFIVLSSESERVVANSKVALAGEARVFDALGPAAQRLERDDDPRRQRRPSRRAGRPAPRPARPRSEPGSRSRTTSTPITPTRRSPSPTPPASRWSSTRTTTWWRRNWPPTTTPRSRATSRWPRATWPDPAWQLTHVSNGRSGLGDAKHSDLIADDAGRVPRRALDRGRGQAQGGRDLRPARTRNVRLKAGGGYTSKYDAVFAPVLAPARRRDETPPGRRADRDGPRHPARPEAGVDERPLHARSSRATSRSPAVWSPTARYPTPTSSSAPPTSTSAPGMRCATGSPTS